jgi:predicted transcriptional regulator
MPWTFITNHGAVLILISRRRQITAREIAAQLGITERSVMRIIKDLADDGYITREKVGRVNRYTIDKQISLRCDDTKHMLVGDLIDVLDQLSDK